MKSLSLTLSNKSPFSIATSRAVGNEQKCLDFIPGTVVRGALASLYIESNKPDNDFKKIFTDNKVVFFNLYPYGAKPIPLSAYSCKYYRGFLGDREKHGVVDLLLSLIRENEGSIDFYDRLKNCQHKENSVTCGSERKRFKGYYKKILSDGSLRSVDVHKRLIYHTAISYASETALENTLYSQEVVEKGQVFQGDILFYDNSLFNNINALIKNKDFIFLGSDKSVGLGKFEIISCKDINNFDKEKLIQRLILFNKKLGINNTKNYFSITLQSDAIITDKYMRYKTFIEPEDLGIPNVRAVLGIAETRIVQGWNAITQLPKEDVLAIEKGSVFVFSVDNFDDNILDKLFELEVYGIGKRRCEGFGRLTVCDSFHLQEGPK
ncbi:MAG: RAMP superfamily CRISPR-associated protein [Thermodesulfovibrionales bacterium]